MSAITCGEARQALVFQAGQIQIRIQGFGESNVIIAALQYIDLHDSQEVKQNPFINNTVGSFDLA
jgi:hypothetical protein